MQDESKKPEGKKIAGKKMELLHGALILKTFIFLPQIFAFISRIRAE
jgi:hypothetical protein